MTNITAVKETKTEVMLSITKGRLTCKLKHLKELVAKLESLGFTDESDLEYVENQNVFRIGSKSISKEPL